MPAKHRRLKKNNLQRPASDRRAAGISRSNATKTLREIEMTKVVSFAVAFVLFAPLAAVTLMQAAHIFA